MKENNKVRGVEKENIVMNKYVTEICAERRKNILLKAETVAMRDACEDCPAHGKCFSSCEMDSIINGCVLSDSIAKENTALELMIERWHETCSNERKGRHAVITNVRDEFIDECYETFNDAVDAMMDKWRMLTVQERVEIWKAEEIARRDENEDQEWEEDF